MTLRLLTIVLSGVALVACSGETTTSSPAQGNDASKNDDDDERGSLGVPPSAADYCQKLGYELDGSTCRFPDGTSCEEWSFYYGTCGQAHSYCAMHGGTVTNESRDMGSYTASVAVCTLDGKKCDESDFYRSGKCE
jgi:putative hemolysin